MFKRWYETWKKRMSCDHDWYKVSEYHSFDADCTFVRQYCPKCEKKRELSMRALNEEIKIKQAKRMYKDK